MDAKRFHKRRLENRKKLGVWLRKVRNENGLTLQNVADGMSIDLGFASKIENGKVGIPDNKLMELVVAYKLNDIQLQNFIDMYLTNENPELYKVLQTAMIL